MLCLKLSSDMLKEGKLEAGRELEKLLKRERGRVVAVVGLSRAFIILPEVIFIPR